MKVLATVLFILNAAALVWFRTLPDDSEIWRCTLDQDAAGKPGALELQVETGRGYQSLFAKHQTANRVAVGILLANACAFFFATVLLVARSQRQESTEPSAARDSSKDADGLTGNAQE